MTMIAISATPGKIEYSTRHYTHEMSFWASVGSSRQSTDVIHAQIRGRLIVLDITLDMETRRAVALATQKGGGLR